MNPWACMFFATFSLIGTWTYQASAQVDNNTFDWSSHPVSRHYTMNDGLPETAVNSVLRDRRGFLWVATYKGLSKFDGYRFITYQHNPASKASLSYNHVNTLWEDRKGRLWVGHGRGVDLFDPQTGFFQFLGPDTIAVLKLRGRPVTQIAYAVGFSSLSYFNKCFKEQFGVTPGQYWDLA